MRQHELVLDRVNLGQHRTVRDQVAVLFRQKNVVLAIFIGVIVAAALSGIWIPKYEAEMKFLVRRERSDAIVTPSANAPTQFFNDKVSEEDLNSEVELLNSNDLLRKVALTCGLVRTIPGRDVQTSIAAAVRSLSDDLKIDAIPKTNVIIVHYAANDPETAAKVLRALSAAYTEKQLEVHRPSGEFTFFDQQTKQYKLSLDGAQKQLSHFSSETGIVSAESERDAALREAEQFDAAARQAESDIPEMERRIAALTEQLQLVQPRLTTAVRTSDNPQLLEQMKSTLLNLQLKRTELLTKFDASYPLVQQIDRQISETDSAIKSEHGEPLRDETTDQNPQFQWVRTELTKSQTDLSSLKQRAVAKAAAATQYRNTARVLDRNGIVQKNLSVDAKTDEDNYLLYLHKREEARISNALDEGGILNVALAEDPIVPSFPKRSALSVAVLAFIFAGTFSISGAFLVDALDPRFRTPDELENYLGRPVFATLPKGHFSSQPQLK